MLALLLALLRAPLAAQYPQPAEFLAAHLLIVTQLTASALLFPYLLRSGASAAAVVATAWPFIVLAGMVSAATTGRVVAAGCYVTAWLVAWWAWNASGSGSGRLGGVAIASLLTSGTLLLFYLRLEAFPQDAGEMAETWAVASPPLAALRQLAGPPLAREWTAPVVIAAAALGRRFIAPRSSQVIHRP